MTIRVNDVIRILEDEGLNYTIINYPEKNKKSIDIIVEFKRSSQEKKKLVVKTSSDKIGKDEITDLKNFSSLTQSIPLIITDETEEDIAIEKDKVIGLSLFGFERLLKGDKIFVYRTRGGMFVRIRPEVLRQKMREMNYSMGDVAKMLGVSRKTIYDYENGDSDVSIEIAEKLIDIFGPEIIGDVCETYQADGKVSVDKDHKVINILESKGFKVATLKFTAVDIIASNNSKKLIITIESRNPENSIKKIQEASKIAEEFNLNMIVISKSSSRAKELEKDGFKVYLDQNLDELKYEISGD
ncbi:helix-turn-helix domain-containing protein [Acidianus ambivalens]|jgi:putative transcriptional regulator|uniref:Putative HTH-type transcriptional regulatory protein D1866_01885 n=1 Tax=Acidianus ambivalens TaxID=2283 RepID=A0A650CSY1_ACIAM|nr:helix-turn-helix domain-containing protein [Acidianus ambivalens]MQL55377.1 helix-turn-helix domain-containing protein [Acidianus ambivalens]QGR20916.1 helix-turn-helix domain-containing protein [Acidianus ambivalens]